MRDLSLFVSLIILPAKSQLLNAVATSILGPHCHLHTGTQPKMFWAFNRELRNFKGRRTAENSNISSILGWEQKNEDKTRTIPTEEGEKIRKHRCNKLLFVVKGVWKRFS